MQNTTEVQVQTSKHLTQTIIQQHGSSLKSWQEVWAQPIATSAGSVLAIIAALIAAIVTAKLSIKNIRDAQEDKHTKDMKREAEGAKRTRQEKRHFQLVDLYSDYFARCITYAEDEVYELENNMHARRTPQEQKDKNAEITEEKRIIFSLKNKIVALDSDTDRRSIATSLQLSLSSEPPISEQIQNQILNCSDIRKSRDRVLASLRNDREIMDADSKA